MYDFELFYKDVNSWAFIEKWPKFSEKLLQFKKLERATLNKYTKDMDSFVILMSVLKPKGYCKAFDTLVTICEVILRSYNYISKNTSATLF